MEFIMNYSSQSEYFLKLSKSKPYKKVRLKYNRSVNNWNKIFVIYLYLIVIYLSNFVPNVLGNHPPKFIIDGGYSEIVLRLKEGPETPIGSLIYQLRAQDVDDDDLEFSVRHTHESDIIKIEKTSKNTANIYLNKELDRETKDEYTIILRLTDNRLGDQNFVTQSLLLLVEDINDNEPIFKPYQSALEVTENGKPGILTTLEATDRDVGAFGQVVYYLQELDGDNDVFSIVTYQGKGTIKLLKSLDYERKNLYQLRILAIDRANQGPQNTATAGIVVKVKDVEDQPPVFSAVMPVTRISEDVPIGTFVLQVKAHDGDRGINNPINYSIVKGGNGLFDVEKGTGKVRTIKKLDREDPVNLLNGAYILEISAVEVSQIIPPPSVTTEITIIVTDINDEIPTFRSNYYEAEVNENAEENTPLNFLGNGKNGIYDYDQGNNGTFELFIEPDNGIFEITPKRAINEATFLIRVKNNKNLDFEELSEMNFTVVAREIVMNGKSRSVPLKIYIRDSNDNSPEFNKPQYSFAIPENSETGTVIGKINAIDKDSGIYGTHGIRYTYLGGSLSNLLHLDHITGIITVKSTGVNNEFDREITSNHYLTVEARDNLGMGNRNTVQIILTILDVNDNSPIFIEQFYETRLFENKLNFENQLFVKAKDADQADTENSKITYEIMDSEYSKNFTINMNSGEISPTYPLDFEQLNLVKSYTNNSNIQQIYLRIRAKDSGIPSRSTNVTVIVYLHDVNDWSPQFQHNKYEVSIFENLSAGSWVIQVFAIDNDGSAPNNQIIYRIKSGASDKFIIDSQTGQISVANGYGAILDPDLSNPKITQYLLSVIAMDGGLGVQQMFNETLVNITILDVNNKPPTFKKPDKINLIENTHVGTILYHLIAYDLDQNPDLHYYIDVNVSEARSEEGILIKSSEYDYISSFHLNETTGVISIAKIIDREKVEQIKLGFIVEDLASANGKQIDKTILTVIIDDENDNNPKFRKPFYKKSIPENSPTGVTIMNVVAYDIDKNRSIKYSLEGPTKILDLIQLDADTGEIVVAKKIDHEQYEYLNYTIRAIDSGIPLRSSLVEVFIRVLDENDNNPYFIPTSQNLSVYENSPNGTHITKIEAKDADSGDFGKITYLIDKIGSYGKFSIDSDSGELFVVAEIDRELTSSYSIVIEVWDNYKFGHAQGESRNAFKQFFIDILDENDNPPILNLPKNGIQISEFHNIHEPITQIWATDADDPKTLNAQLEFSIIGGSGKDLFTIVQSDYFTCDILARLSLQNYYGNYSLKINVKDLGIPRNEVQSEMFIYVMDFNDHAPIFVLPPHNTTVRIPENATVGTELIQVKAIDNDIGENAAVLYRLKHDSVGNYKTFSIDQITGSLTLKLPLDRERQKLYDIRIEAFDKGLPTPLSTDLDLSIYVTNVNDYEPQFLVDVIAVNFTEHRKPGDEKIKLPDTIDRDEVDDLDDPPSSVCYFIVFGNEDMIFDLEPETHILTILKELDREIKENYTLIIKATEDCNRIPENLYLKFNTTVNQSLTSHHSLVKNIRSNLNNFDRFKHSRNLRNIHYDNEWSAAVVDERQPKFESLIDGILVDDNTLVQVQIHVDDINDNAPQFITKIFTGGVTTAADFGSIVMEIKAFDKDYGKNAKISYYQLGDIHRTLTEGIDHLKKPAFLVDKFSGNILLNFDPQKEMKGYFDFMVLANDTDNLNDVAHVFIYLLREDQRVRFVLRQQPAQIRSNIQVFRDALSNVTNAIVNVDEFKIHENRDGSVDRTKTDIYLHLVNRKDNSILEVSDILRLIDQNIEKLDGLFKEFNVLDTQPSESLLLMNNIQHDNMIVWLILSNIFLGALIILILFVCFSQKRNYKRELKAAYVHTSYGTSHLDRQFISTVPNTNKHSSEGSNPIWLKAYANEWFKNDEDLSNNGVNSLVSINAGTAPDSLDENILINGTDINFLSNDNEHSDKQFNGFHTQNNLGNVYHQINRLTNNAQLLAKKLETTEL